MLSRCLLVLIAFAMNPFVLEAQEKPHETWLTFLEGTWDFKMSNGQAGKLTYKRPPGNNGLTFCASSEDFTLTGLIGWDEDWAIREYDYIRDAGKLDSQVREFIHVTKDSLKGTGRPLGSNNPANIQQVEYTRVSDNEMTLTGSGGPDGKWSVHFTRETPAAHMAILAPFIGTWKHESILTEAFGPVEAGDRMQLTDKFSWQIDKHAVLLEWTFQKNDEKPAHGIELLGWDREAYQIRSIMQTTDGSQDSGVWTCDGKTLTWSGSGLDVAGARTKATVQFTLTQPDELALQFLDQQVDGQPVPDSEVYKLQRVP